jgi:DNA-binding ferritin-like protein
MPRTIKNRNSNRRKTIKLKSKKNFKIDNQFKSEITKVFLELLNMVKLYHWKTYSYAQHKATDELYASLNKHIDKFIEVLLGKDSSRIHMVSKKINLIDFNNTTDFKERIYSFREFFTRMDKNFNKKRDIDLLTLRDELLIDINQFLYLMTFDK